MRKLHFGLPPEGAVARLRAGRVALVCGLLIFAMKLAAYFATSSSAVFSDAAESVVNVIAGALLLYSLGVAVRPADRDHPYGHGKAEFFCAGVEGSAIAVAGVWIIYRALQQLFFPKPLQHLDAGLALVALASLFNAVVAHYLIRTGRRVNSLALIADGQHLWTDVVTSGGVLIGLALVWATGWLWLDPLVAFLVAIHILATGWKLVREAVGGLMDEADEATLLRIAQSLEASREHAWIDVHSLRAFRTGSSHHIDFHMVVPRYYSADQLHAIDDRVHKVLFEAADLHGDVIVHFDPCRPRQCSYCAMENCPVRQAAFAKREPLTLGRTTRFDETLDTGTPLVPEAE